MTSTNVLKKTSFPQNQFHHKKNPAAAGGSKRSTLNVYMLPKYQMISVFPIQYQKWIKKTTTSSIQIITMKPLSVMRWDVITIKSVCLLNTNSRNQLYWGGWMYKARKNAKFVRNMVKFFIKNGNVLQMFSNFCKKKTEISISMINFPSKLKRFPSKSTFFMTMMRFPNSPFFSSIPVHCPLLPPTAHSIKTK